MNPNKRFAARPMPAFSGVRVRWVSRSVGRGLTETRRSQARHFTGRTLAPAVSESSQPERAQPSPEEARLIVALRNRDERAFTFLVQQYHNSLLQLMAFYVANRAVAEEVVQDTWVGVLQGIGRFEGRSSLKTWPFRILVNRAKTRAVQEGRSIPFSTL